MVFIKIEATIALRSFLLELVMLGHRSRCLGEDALGGFFVLVCFSVLVSFGVKWPRRSSINDEVKKNGMFES